MTCNSCHRRFIIDPKTHQFNDYKFKHLLEQVGEEGNTHFTFNQLYSSYLLRLARKNKKTRSEIFYVLIGCSIVLAILQETDSAVPYIVSGFFLMASIFRAIPEKAISSANFKEFMISWNKQNPIPNWIETPSLQQAPSTPEEGDLHDYGVEGIIFVDQDIYVDLLVKNQLHLDLKMVVVAQSGYPNYLKTTVQGLLNQSSPPPLYYLHDSDTNIATMEQAILSNWSIQQLPTGTDWGISKADWQQVKFLKSIQSSQLEQLHNLDSIPPKQFSSSLVSALGSSLLIGAALQEVTHGNAYFASDFG